MSRSLITVSARSRKIEQKLRNAINSHGRKTVCDVLDLSEGHVCKFMAGNKEDAKINIVSLSKLIAELGLKLIDSELETLPANHQAVPDDIVAAAIGFTKVGLSQLEANFKKNSEVESGD